VLLGGISLLLQQYQLECDDRHTSQARAIPLPHLLRKELDDEPA
jgi:hypothetical protein